MKKICLIFYGQLRTFDNTSVINSWTKIFSKFDCDSYMSVWDNRGRSAYSKLVNINDQISEQQIIKIEDVEKIFKPKKIKIFNYKNWFENLDENIKKYSNNYYFNSTFAAGFLRYNAFQEIENKYDAYFLVRPDLFFFNDIDEDLLEDLSFIKHQNVPKIFFPNRIYDIFIISNYENIKFLCDWYINPLKQESIEKNFGTNLNFLDPCKVLYTYSILNNKKIKSTNKWYADVYRSDVDKANYEREK